MVIKIAIFVLCFAILFLLREGFCLYRGLKNPDKYKLTIWRQVGIAASISYIMTLIITGI